MPPATTPSSPAPPAARRNSYTAEVHRTQAVLEFERRGERANRAKSSAPEAAFQSLMRKPETGGTDASSLRDDAPNIERRRYRGWFWFLAGVCVVVAVQLVLLQFWSRIVD